jgi:hypothetical protein
LSGVPFGGRAKLVLSLLADPELPAELAEQLAGELPELLAERLDDQVSWQIGVLRQRFDLADEDRLLTVAHQRRARSDDRLSAGTGRSSREVRIRWPGRAQEERRTWQPLSPSAGAC